MAKLYEWEGFLTPEEKQEIADKRHSGAVFRHSASVCQRDIDTIRRKAVQRARNALNKRLRAEHREKVQS